MTSKNLTESGTTASLFYARALPRAHRTYRRQLFTILAPTINAIAAISCIAYSWYEDEQRKRAKLVEFESLWGIN